MAANLALIGTGASSSTTSSSKPAEALRGPAVQKSKMQLLMQKIALQRALAVATEYWSEQVDVSDGETAARCGEPEHMTEMRSALLSAGAWQEAVFGITPCLQPVEGVWLFDCPEVSQPQQLATKQSLRGFSFSAEAPPSEAECDALLSDDGKSGASTAEGACSGLSASSDSEEDSPRLLQRCCWVYGAQLKDVPELLRSGIAAPVGPRNLCRSTKRSSSRRCSNPKLFSGPWGRTGIGCIGAEALVYIDIAAARAAGAELRYCKSGLELGSRGTGIPASCIRKVVRIVDCEELFERRVRAPSPLPEPAETLGVEITSGSSPLAALLRSMADS